VYTATPIAAPVASGGPSGSGAPRPMATASPLAPAGSGSAAPVEGVDPAGPIRFAVDLFDIDESAIAPGAPRVLEDLGKARPAPGASGVPGSASAVETRPNARDEIWIPIVFIVLVALCFEWALYHRDTVLRGWRAITGRLRRGSPAGGS